MFPSEMALRIMLISSAVSVFFLFLNGAFCIQLAAARKNSETSLLIFLSPCTILLPKLLHNSNKSRTFAITELVCIPSELQASHFFYYKLRIRVQEQFSSR